MLQQTSLLAFNKLENVNAKQKMVYESIKRMVASSNYDIAQDLGWEINRVTPRVMELREKGLVQEVHRDTHPVTNRRVIYWGIVKA